MVEEMISLVGKAKTEHLLIVATISPSMAGKLRRGTYDSEMSFESVAKIARALNAARETAAQAAS